MKGKQIQDILAANVIRVRNEMGYSQSKLAELTGISNGYLCDIENGRKWPGSEIIAALALILKMDPYQLFLPSEDSPYFDRHRTLTSFCRQVKEVVADSVDEVFDRLMQPYGPRRSSKPEADPVADDTDGGDRKE